MKTKVFIVPGFLDAGKTTLLKRVLNFSIVHGISQYNPIGIIQNQGTGQVCRQDTNAQFCGGKK
jgi:molybdopterin-guanine dinucleotide biosynthesis protein